MTINKLEYWLIGFLIIQFLIFSPFIEKVNIQVLLFGFTSLIIFILSPMLTIKYIVSKNNIQLNIFLFLTVINGVWSQINGNKIDDIIRSILPFLYLYLIYIASSQLQYKQFKHIFNTFVIVIYIISIYDFLFLFLNGYLFDSHYRITFDSIYSALPFNIIISLYIIIYMNSKWKYLLLIIPFLIILQSQSKGLIGLTVLMLVFLVLHFSKTKKVMFAKILLIIGLLLAVLLNIDSISILNRFTLVGSEKDVTTLGRLQEISQAMGYFLEHTILGNGAGTVFLHIFNDGTLEERRYTHNALFYFLAIGGAPMALSYLYIFIRQIYLIIFSKINSLGKGSNDLLFIGISLFIILSYSMVSATYKLIHTNIVVGLLLAFSNYLMYKNKTRRIV